MLILALGKAKFEFSKNLNCVETDKLLLIRFFPSNPCVKRNELNGNIVMINVRVTQYISSSNGFSQYIFNLYGRWFTQGQVGHF